MLQDDLIGTTLGNYRILAPLGQGGMARVYKAHQETLDREVAVKVLPPWYAADRSFVERFNLEARLVARLSHPNIVTVHDASEQNGHLYIVMQLVDGGTLKHRLDILHAYGQVMEIAEATPIFTQLASALVYAHEQGIIHRDVKPVNVLMDRSGRPILSDFGIAKVLASTKDHLTRPGAGVGTPEYMSPEQCLGGRVDGRADIYALGVMLFESLTGRTPFIGDNYPVLAHSHIYEPPPRPGMFNPAIPPAIEQVILTALMKNPSQRYQRASDMAEALELAQNQQIQQAAYLHAQYTPQLPMGAFGAPLQQGEQFLPSQPVYPMQPGHIPFPGQQSGSPLNERDMAQRNVYAPQPRYAAAPALHPCYHCHHLNKPNQKFCTRCGTPLNQCATCGVLNPVHNRFCVKCGQPLAL